MVRNLIKIFAYFTFSGGKFQLGYLAAQVIKSLSWTILPALSFALTQLTEISNRLMSVVSD